MNSALKLLYNRKSLRRFADRPVTTEIVDLILGAVRRAPTAGNLCLYSVIEIREQATKDELARTCDDQPFIAKAPLALLFVADYQRLYDYLRLCGAEEYARERGIPFSPPDMGNLMLACQDTMIAAHTAVVAAETLGLGSCYIGDIMEQYERHRELFDLPDYAFPLSLVVAGYPAGDYYQRRTGARPARETLFFTDRYRRLPDDELASLYDPIIRRRFPDGRFPTGAPNYGLDLLERKYAAEFSAEMNRSVKAAMRAWEG